VRPHACRQREVREDRERTEIDLAIGVRAPGAGTDRQVRGVAPDLVEGNIQKIAREMESGLAVQGDAAQHTAAYPLLALQASSRAQR
jgi:hypothetical protein